MIEDEIFELARDIVHSSECVVRDPERLAAEFPHRRPLDCEGFRVALIYARKILRAAEQGEYGDIDLAWLEPIKDIR